MHGAPSVSYPVGRSRNAGRLLLILWLGGVCAAVAAAAALGKADWRVGLLALSVIVAGFAAWSGTLRRTLPGVMTFDGRHWALDSGPAGLRQADASVALDFQSMLLVKLTEPGRAEQWIWLDRSSSPERWQDLRRAVYSRAPSTGPVADHGATAAASAHHPSS